MNFRFPPLTGFLSTQSFRIITLKLYFQINKGKEPYIFQDAHHKISVLKKSKEIKRISLNSKLFSLILRFF